MCNSKVINVQQSFVGGMRTRVSVGVQFRRSPSAKASKLFIVNSAGQNFNASLRTVSMK